ncbi:hypothetical protein OAO01_07070, partial [Oligoflexia bacterium]|nr:hypothetical protein [Oligoflexia bacterium]
EKLGLRKIKTVQFEYLTPERFRESSATDGNQASAYVFHRFVPAVLPEAASLFIFPPKANDVFPRKDEVSGAQITRWLHSHPVTSYLNLPVLALNVIAPLDTPAWANELIATTHGSAAYLGNYKGQKTVVLGFELLPYAGTRSPVLSILTLNILKWLSDVSVSPGYRATGSPVPNSEGIEAVTYSNGDRVLDPTFSRPGLASIKETGQQAAPVAINYFDTQESNLMKPGLVQMPSQMAYQTDTDDQQLLAKLIAYFVLLLLVLDLFLVSGVITIIKHKVLQGQG